MLVFKNNIYEPYHSNNGNLVLTPNEDYNQRFDPRNLIQVALKEEKIGLNFAKKCLKNDKVKNMFSKKDKSHAMKKKDKNCTK